MEHVVLHRQPDSPYCDKVERVLSLKGIYYERIVYAGRTLARAKQLVPSGQVPVVDWDGERVASSARIVRLIDRHYPSPSLFPSDPRLRAMVDVLENWADDTLYWLVAWARTHDAAIMAEVTQHRSPSAITRRRVRVGLMKEYEKKLDIRGLGSMETHEVYSQVEQHLDNLDDMLVDGGWLVAQRRTLADIAVSVQLEALLRHGPIRDRVRARHHVERWLEKQRPLDTVTLAVPPLPETG